MTDAFIAIVVSGDPVTGFLVEPQITEHDGTPHPPITCGVVEGIDPTPGDYVLILTTRNNLDNLPVQRYFEASEACGRIVAVVKTPLKYVFRGDYEFIGDVDILGDFSSTGNATISGNCTIAGTLTVGGVVVNGHTHYNNAPAPGPTGPMV